MAGNQNSGRNVTFALSEKELEKHIEAYKNRVISGELERPNWAHFCASLNRTEEEIKAVMACDGIKTSAYHRRALMLKRFCGWMRGAVCSLPGWSGGNSTKANFLLRQDWGDGVKYEDKNSDTGGPVSIRVSFGGDDRRGKAASK